MNPSERPDRSPAAASGINQDIRLPHHHWLHGAHGASLPGISRDLPRFAPASSPSPWNRFTVDGSSDKTSHAVAESSHLRRAHLSSEEAHKLQPMGQERQARMAFVTAQYLTDILSTSRGHRRLFQQPREEGSVLRGNWGSSQRLTFHSMGSVHVQGPAVNNYFPNRQFEDPRKNAAAPPPTTSPSMATHAISTGATASRKKKWRPHCQLPTCLRPASYASEAGQDPILCEKHKAEGMQNVVHPNRGECNEEGCKRVSAYASTAETLASYCYLHKKEGMVKVRDGIGTRCENAQCVKQASFALEGERYPRFCKDHKKDEMINIRNNRCVAEGCPRGASFAPVGERRGLYCGEHKGFGMINTRRRPRCVAPGCNSREPIFILEGQHVPRYCAKHKKEGMQDVRQVVRTICAFSDCSRPPVKGSAGETLPDFCEVHQGALESSSGPRSKIPECMAPNCASPPTHGWETAMVPVLCEAHAQDGMVNIALSRRGASNHPNKGPSMGDPIPKSTPSDALATDALHVLGPAPPDPNDRDREKGSSIKPSTAMLERPAVRPIVRVFGTFAKEQAQGMGQDSTLMQQPGVRATEHPSIRVMRVGGKPPASAGEDRANKPICGTEGPALRPSPSNNCGTTPSRVRSDSVKTSNESSSKGQPPSERGITISVNGDGPAVQRGSLTFFPADFAPGTDGDDLLRPANRNKMKRAASPMSTKEGMKRVKQEIDDTNSTPLAAASVTKDPALGDLYKDYQGWQVPRSSANQHTASAPQFAVTKKFGLEDCHPPGYTRTEFFYSLVGALTSTKTKRRDGHS